MIIAAASTVTNPIAIFLIVLTIILLAPILLNRLKIPHIIGMIVAGVIVGPHGFNILADDSSFTIFGQVGLLYLMFLAGIEIDMYHLRLNLRRGLLFGLLTFLVPLVLGAVTSVYLLGLDWLTSTLLGAMYASHTLIAYPVVARFGVSRSPSVLISIVGTIIAVIGALIVLAVTVNIQSVGAFDMTQLLWLIGKMAAYCAATLYIYPRLTRYFFKVYGDGVTQYVFILALVFLSSLVAKWIGLEGVLGAFFAGLVLNRFIPGASPLMSRIEFVGNALFIPYFLIGVGMMINLNVIGNSQTLIVTAIMLAVALSSKWIAAYIAQKIYGMDSTDRRMMFGLTTAHTAVALAVVTIGYNMILPDGTRLMDETILNGTVLVILITCAVAPIVTSRAASRTKIRSLENDTESTTAKNQPVNSLISIANPVTAQPLVDMALLMRPRRNTIRNSISALHVRNDNTPGSKAIARNSLDLARQAGSAANCNIDTIDRFDLNTVTGLINVIQERDINEVFIGLHRKTTIIDSFLGAKVEQLLKQTNKMLVISRCYIPLNTITRIVVYVPPKAQFETGFIHWLHSLANLASEIGCRIIFCCPDELQHIIRTILKRDRYNIRAEYRLIAQPDDFQLLSNRILEDDLLVVIQARPNSISYSPELAEIPGFVKKYFAANNIVIIFPEQFGAEPAMETFVDPMASDITSHSSPWFTRLRARLLHRRNRSKSKIEL